MVCGGPNEKLPPLIPTPQTTGRRNRQILCLSNPFTGARMMKGWARELASSFWKWRLPPSLPETPRTVSDCHRSGTEKWNSHGNDRQWHTHNNSSSRHFVKVPSALGEKNEVDVSELVQSSSLAFRGQSSAKERVYRVSTNCTVLTLDHIQTYCIYTPCAYAAFVLLSVPSLVSIFPSSLLPP